MNNEDKTGQTRAASAASALTDGLGVLSQQEREVYEHLESLGKSWCRPMDVGGSDGSHHSRTLAKLVRLGLAERKQRGSMSGMRGSWEYRALDTPNVRGERARSTLKFGDNDGN